MSSLLVGLREQPVEVTAVVSVSDDGGSSGRLRKDFDIAPPGDIRNCLLALSGQEPLWARLLDYRFQESELAGHSIGNLLITALTANSIRPPLWPPSAAFSRVPRQRVRR